MKSDDELAIRRFSSANGKIFSNDQNAFSPALTTTRARQILNEIYAELCKHDRESAERICKQHNA